MGPHSMGEMSTIVGHIVLFLTTLAGFGFQWLREGRRHTWEQQKYDALKRQIDNGKA